MGITEGPAAYGHDGVRHFTGIPSATGGLQPELFQGSPNSRVAIDDRIPPHETPQSTRKRRAVDKVEDDGGGSESGDSVSLSELEALVKAKKLKAKGKKKAKDGGAKGKGKGKKVGDEQATPNKKTPAKRGGGRGAKTGEMACRAGGASDEEINKLSDVAKRAAEPRLSQAQRKALKPPRGAETKEKDAADAEADGKEDLETK